jgi:hypothetical protein
LNPSDRNNRVTSEPTHNGFISQRKFNNKLKSINMKHFRLTTFFALAFGLLIGMNESTGQVVISQVYGGGGNSGATYTNDFIELLNTGTTDVSLNGWSVQYASATGTSWQVTNLTSPVLMPGQYYLIQQAQGTGGTIPLPTPDAIGIIPLAAASGKVALVANTIALAGSCPSGPDIMDFVGYGTANCFEGSGAAPLLSNANAGLRLNDGCTDTNDNAADFIAGAPIPRNTSSPFNNCSIAFVATPVFDPPGGVYSSAQNVVITTSTPGAQIYYTTDGTDPDENNTLYMGPVNISGNITTLKARAYATGFNPSLIATAVYYIPVNVPDISTLRAGSLGAAYKLTGQAVLTFQQVFRHQKYIQDATAAILIDDEPGIITTGYSLYDGITGITGILNVFGNMMQFTPIADPGNPTSSGNVITPQVITLAQLNTNFMDYQAELVKVMNVSFADGGGTFANNTVYPVSDGSKAAFNFRTTFNNVDYIGQQIPGVATITVLPNSRSEGNYITSRSLADFQVISNPAVKLVITSVNNSANPVEDTEFPVTVQAQDVNGAPAFPPNNIHFTFSTNGGTGGTVAFASGSVTTGTITGGTSQVVVTGVKMAPAGTNVTITATDNNPFGLQPGTSAPFDVVELTIPLAAWTFDATPGAPNTPTSVAANLGLQAGSAVLYADGSNGSSLWDQATELNSFAGTLINDPRTDGSAFAGLSYCPVAGTDLSANGKSMVLKFSMENFQDPILTFATRGTSTGFNAHQWAWSTDNVTYTNFGVNTVNTTTSFLLKTLDMSEIDALDQAPEVYLRVTFTGASSSSGNNRLDNIVIYATEAGEPTFSLNLKVFLEGPFNTTTATMSSYLKTEDLLPNVHPFDPPLPYYGNNTPKWLYNGSGMSLALPANAVDWVLVELRDALSAASATSAASIAYKPGLLLSDGSVVAPNGVSLLGFNTIINDYMFIVVWSRNHLGIMSSTGIAEPSGTVSWDFTTAAGQTYGANGSKELTPGIWGMFAGDVNADGIVNDADKSPAGWKTEVGEQGYLGSDLNLDSQSSNVDKNQFWLPNYLKNTQVPN